MAQQDGQLGLFDIRSDPGCCMGPQPITVPAAARTVRYVASLHASEWVTFNPLEYRSAVIVGTWIWEHSHADGRRDRHAWKGFTDGPDAGRHHQELGSLTERIGAKALGIYWPSAFNNFADADLPHNVEVRLIGLDHYGLRVYPRTHDTRRVLGVVIPRGFETGNPVGSYRYRVAGWFLAKDAKRPEWERAPHGRPPMFCVPQTELRSVASLRQIIAQEKLAEFA